MDCIVEQFLINLVSFLPDGFRHTASTQLCGGLYKSPNSFDSSHEASLMWYKCDYTMSHTDTAHTHTHTQTETERDK